MPPENPFDLAAVCGRNDDQDLVASMEFSP